MIGSSQSRRSGRSGARDARGRGEGAHGSFEGLLNPNANRVNVTLYLRDLRQSLLMQLLLVSSQFATDLLSCY